MFDVSDNQEVWYTVTQAANRLGVSDMTIRRWIGTGYFPGAIRLSPQRNSEYRIPLKDIEAFEEKRKVQ